MENCEAAPNGYAATKQEVPFRSRKKSHINLCLIQRNGTVKCLVDDTQKITKSSQVI